jgi:hypothetical protein
MPWKDKTPDEVAKELFGMDAATAKAKLEKLDSMEVFFAENKRTLETQNTLIQELSNSLKATNARVQSPYESNAAQPQQSHPTQPQLTDWSEDADKAFQERSAPLVGTVLDTRALIAKRNVMDNLNAQYHDWHLFNDEIDEISKNSPLQSKVMEEFWRNCYFAVKGRHHDDIIRDQNQKSGKFWIEPASSAVMMRDETPKNPEDSLTAEDKKIAEGLGVPLKNYAENKDKFRLIRS